MIICRIDKSEHPDREALHLHLRKMKMKQEDYYTVFEPRRDKFTNEIIPYKAPAEKYLAQEFINKNNLKKWIKGNSPEAQAWAIDWLRKRKEAKQLIYPPTQVELRSLMCPTIAYYDFIGGYNKICESLGYTIRYNGTFIEKSMPKDVIIIADTREQKPLTFKYKTISKKLECGDYALAKPHDQNICIERKSLDDFVATLSDRQKKTKTGNLDSALERFDRELTRAKEAGTYIVMLVESNINEALGFNYLPQFSRIRGKRTLLPEHIFKNLRDLLIKFDNFQALFVNDRNEAADAVVKLLAAGTSIKTIDIQYSYDTKKITFN